MIKTKEFMQNLGKFLKKKRNEAGLTQRDIKTMFNYNSGQFVSNWERGLIVPPTPTLKALLKVYQVTDKEIKHYIVNPQMKLLGNEFNVEI